jgi:hypothetical protein
LTYLENWASGASELLKKVEAMKTISLLEVILRVHAIPAIHCHRSDKRPQAHPLPVLSVHHSCSRERASSHFVELASRFPLPLGSSENVDNDHDYTNDHLILDTVGELQMGWDIRRICLRSDPTNILRC